MTLRELCQRDHLDAGGLQEGVQYEVVRASFGRSDGICGSPRDTGRAHLILRHPESGQLFLIRPETELGMGADGGGYDWRALSCQPITEA